MTYLDKTFWRMAFGFALIIGLGLFGVYLLSNYRDSLGGGASLTWRL